MRYHVKFGSSVTNGVPLNRKEPPKIRERWDLAPLGLGRGWPPKQAPPHICYHVKCGSSSSKGMRINRREPRKLGCAWAPPLAVGAWLTPWKYAYFHMRYPPEFGHSRSKGTSVLRRYAWKIWPLASRLSRSLKVIETDTEVWRCLQPSGCNTRTWQTNGTDGAWTPISLDGGTDTGRQQIAH